LLRGGVERKGQREHRGAARERLQEWMHWFLQTGCVSNLPAGTAMLRRKCGVAIPLFLSSGPTAFNRARGRVSTLARTRGPACRIPFAGQALALRQSACSTAWHGILVHDPEVFRVSSQCCL
jgi:hypothetical protein